MSIALVPTPAAFYSPLAVSVAQADPVFDERWAAWVARGRASDERFRGTLGRAARLVVIAAALAGAVFLSFGDVL